MSHQISLARFALRTARRPFLGALAGTVLAGGLGLVQMLALASVLLCLLEQRQLLPAMALFIGLLVLRQGLAAIAEWQAAQASAAVRADLRHNLYRALMEQGPVALSTTTSGQLTSVLIERVEACDAYVARYLPALAGIYTLPALTLLLVGLFQPYAALILLAVLLLMPLLLAIFGSLAKRASERQFIALTRMGGLFADRLRNLTLLRALSAAESEQEKLAQSTQAFRKRTMAVLRVAFLSAGVQDVLLAGAIVAQVFLLLHVGAGLSVALPVLLLTLEFFAPLRALAAAYHDRASATAALSEITPLLQTAHKTAPGRRFLPEPLYHPSLDIMKVSYTYPGRTTPALREFSLRVEGSEFLALTGPSGGGKSTLFSLLLGFIDPQAGTLAVAQQPLAQIDPSQRARLFSYVGQRTRLFHGTLAENIRLGDPTANDDSVRAAAHAARLDEVIAGLPDGLNTRLGERGYGLSGGQAQRVALARAFLRNTPILLLDEPTAGLDAATAQDVLLAIKALARERTVIMVSHDAAALKLAERVVRVGEVQYA
jgi:ATP-binding cassette, subfamily C, bacterial CydD